MTDLEPSSDWRTWSITVPSPASEQSVTSSPLQTSATLYSIFREIATPFLNFFSIFLRFFPFRLFSAVRSKSQLPLAFFGRPFFPFSRPFYPLIRAFLSRSQCPLVHAFLFRFERYFHKLSPFAPPNFCLFCIIRSFMSVPSDLILFHPARRFIVLKQFSAFCQSSDVSLVIHHFSFFTIAFLPVLNARAAFLPIIEESPRFFLPQASPSFMPLPKGIRRSPPKCRSSPIPSASVPRRSFRAPRLFPE